jgi:hypothetical protein
MEADLEALKKSIGNGGLKDRYKMERRLGRIQARNPQVNDLFEVGLQDTPVGVRLLWEMKKIGRLGGTCGKALTCCVRI